MKLAICALAVTVLAGMAFLVSTPVKTSSAQPAAPAGVNVPGVRAVQPAPVPRLPEPAAPAGINVPGESFAQTAPVPAHPAHAANPWGGPMYAGPLADNPEAAERYQEEVEAATEAQRLIGQFQQAASDDERAQLREQLREALVRQFEAQQARRTLEIESIEERLAKYKEKVQKREDAKDMIVDRRLDQLTGVGDDLGWEETGVGPHAGYPVGPSPAPHYAPADVAPAGLPPAAAPLTAPGSSAGVSVAPWPSISAFPTAVSEPAAAANP